MMSVILLLLFSLVQIYIGVWTLSFLNRDKEDFQLKVEHIFLSLLIGMGIETVLFLFLDIFFIPLSGVSLFVLNLVVVGILFYLDRKYQYIKSWKVRLDLSIFDIIPILFIVGICIISIWRTIYYPPYSYDSMMGIDLIAKYAERDGSIARSELFQDLVPRAEIASNQLFYAPFTMLMQSIYRIIGIPFGQVWLGILSLSFWLYFYLVSRREVHPVLAQVGIYFLILAPEYFAYSFILQTDFNNAVFFFIGAYFFYKYCKSGDRSSLYLSMLGMFFACWSRTETIFFIPFLSLYLLGLDFIRNDKKFSFGQLKLPFVYTLIPTIAVAIWSLIYVKFYLPKTANLFGQMELSFAGIITKISGIIDSMNSVVVFSDIYWGSIVNVFMIVLLVSIPFAWFRKKLNGMSLLYVLLVMYITFVLLTLVFPAVSVQNTFRRGFFKFLPLFSFFIVISPAFMWINDFLSNSKKTSSVNQKQISK